MINPFKDQVKINIKKAIGSLQKIEEMIDKEKYCIDIAQQLNAVLGLLRNANKRVLESHLNTCGKKLSSTNKEEKEKFIIEILQLCSVTNRK